MHRDAALVAENAGKTCFHVVAPHIRHVRRKSRSNEDEYCQANHAVVANLHELPASGRHGAPYALLKRGLPPRVAAGARKDGRRSQLHQLLDTYDVNVGRFATPQPRRHIVGGVNHITIQIPRANAHSERRRRAVGMQRRGCCRRPADIFTAIIVHLAGDTRAAAAGAAAEVAVAAMGAQAVGSAARVRSVRGVHRTRELHAL
mmetsp:Transcript_28675/g.78835  ORF Transcript_28675/g.78835 Transcript_28675/m.78835 type:complete len:203 (+) Transcript_28675:853-1461(+)